MKGVTGVVVALARAQEERTLANCTSSASVSIIIPALNESAGIVDTISYLSSLEPAPLEIIVVDGGSTDGTVSLARKAGAKTVRSDRRGRSAQMNKGAEFSRGDIFMFVHADTRPPKDAVSRARAALSDPSVVLGGFTTSIEYNGKILWFTTMHQFISTYYAPLLCCPLGWLRGLRCLFGDQSLFCRRDDFRRVGGYNHALPIMEDADLCVRLHHGGLKNGGRGREVQLLGGLNRTSGRRIASWGNLRSTLVHIKIALAWWRGSSPEQLWNLYRSDYTDIYR